MILVFAAYRGPFCLSCWTTLQEAKAAVRQGCALANELARRVNDAKGRIDSTLAQLQHQEEQQQGRDEHRGDEAGEKEESVKRVLLAQLKRRKREYRDVFEKLAEAKAKLRNSKQDKQKVINRGMLARRGQWAR